MRDPQKELAVAHDRLAPGGILVVEVPFFDSFSWRTLGCRHRHCYRGYSSYFNEASLALGASSTSRETGYASALLEVGVTRHQPPIATGCKGGPIRAISVVSVIVPAYNEVATIGGTLTEICAYFRTKPYDFEIIVAADGDDGTREQVGLLAEREPRLTVIGQRERRGKGFGIRQGVRLARGDVIGFVDADNKTPIGEFQKFEGLLAAGCDVVIGSRGLSESRVERPQPLHRRIGSRAFGVFMHTVIGLKNIPDTQCGFKFFRREAAVDVFSRQRIDGYMFDVEILNLASRAGYRIEQVPVRWHDDGDSRLQLVRGNMRNFTDIMRIHLSRYRRAAHCRSDASSETVFASGKTSATPLPEKQVGPSQTD